MIQISKILVPTDFSEGSKVAYTYANEFATKFGGKIDFIHVIPTLKYLNESISNLGFPLDLNKDVYPRLVDQSRGYIEDDLNEYIDAENRGTTTVSIDVKPFEVITETAVKNNYDIVILGTRGMSADSFIKGNVTEKVIRYSKVPVLCVPKAIPENKIRKIVVPIDFSDHSWAALPIAASYAAAIGGQLILLHIRETIGAESDVPQATKSSENKLIREELFEKFIQYAEKDPSFTYKLKSLPDQNFDLMISESDGQQIETEVHSVVRKGVSAHHEITDYSNDNGDMLIMTTHGRSGLRHIFLGSTTEKVARYAKIPVLTIRPDLS